MRMRPLAALALSMTLAACSKSGTEPQAAASAEKKLKAGFILPSPVGDFGFSYAHEQARLAVQKKLPWLETVVVEAVPEADAPRIIDRLVREQACDVVFTASFGYMDATLDAGRRHPGAKFMHCAGFKRSENVGTYFADLYQMFYLNGLMAGALSKSGKVGYVAAHPIPEVVRHIDAFAIGVREANPEAEVRVKWLYSWYDPGKAKEAAEALVAEGCDALAFTEDSTAVIQVAQERTLKGRPVYTFSHYSPMQKFGPDSVVSGRLADWAPLYEAVLTSLHEGRWESRDWFWLAGEKVALLGGEPGQPVNRRLEPLLKAARVGQSSLYDLVMKRLGEVSRTPPAFEPFTGPLKDNKGALRLKAGERAPLSQLLSLDWLVEGVVGDLPRG